MNYSFLLLSVFLLNPCFAQEAYSGHYADTFSGIKAGKRFSHQEIGGAYVILNRNGFYPFPDETEKQKVILAHPQMGAFLNTVKGSEAYWSSGHSFSDLGKNIGVVFNKDYAESYKMLEASKALTIVNMREVLQHREAGFNVIEPYKAGSLDTHSHRMNNSFPMLMFSGPNGGGGGGPYMIKAVGPNGGGGGGPYNMKAYRWEQEGISEEELKEWIQKTGIADQFSFYVAKGFNFKNPAMYEQADILEKALGVQTGFGSMDGVSREEFIEAFMEAQKNLQQYYENDNAIWSNYHGKNIGYIDSNQSVVTAIPTGSLWNETEAFVGDFSWVIQEVPFDTIKAILLNSQGGVR